MAQILVVDDDVQVLTIIQRSLEKQGYDVETAADGIEAMKCIHRKPVDLIITDLLMPKKEGIETIIEIRRDFPKIKIIAMSGGSRLVPEHFLNVASKIGANRVFTKPFDRKDLLQAVEVLLAANGCP